MYSTYLENRRRMRYPQFEKQALFFDRRRGVWSQDRSWNAAEAGRHALDCQRANAIIACAATSSADASRISGKAAQTKAGGCMASLI